MTVRLIAVSITLVLLAACGRDRTPGTVPAVDAGTGSDSGTAGAGPVAPAQSELTRVTSRLASPDFAGREDGTPGGAAARAFLIEELTNCGVEPAAVGGYEQPIVTGQGVNILGRIPGTDEGLSARHVLLSAHYDHLGTREGFTYLGADDNAAGVSVVLGIACALVASPARRSVLVAFWDAEEPPTFLTNAMGSQYYVDNPIVPLAETDVAIVLDLVGGALWPGYAGHFLMGAELSPEVGAAIDGATVPDGLTVFRAGLHLAEMTPFGQQPWSDYDAFRDANVPFLFLSNGQSKRYHTPNDELESLDWPKLALEAEHLTDVVWNLGNADATPTFDPARYDDLRDAQSVRDVLTQALAPGGLVESLGLSASSRGKLMGDLNASSEVADRMAAGPAEANEGQRSTLRAGVQRVMCLAGSTYEESLCGLL